MNLSRVQRYTFDSIRREIDGIIKNPTTIYTSVNALSCMFHAMITHRSDNWAAHVMNDKGQPMFTEQEQAHFTQLFQPYMSIILAFFGKSIHSGGAEDPEKTAPKTEDPEKTAPTKAEDPEKTAPTKAEDPEKTAPKTEEPEKEEEPKTEEKQGIDDLYTKVIKQVEAINSIVTQHASSDGVLRFERDDDTKEDVQLIPEALQVFIAGPNPVVKKTLEMIKLSRRTLVFLIYTAFDAIRMAATVSGSEQSRKYLSVAMSLLELLRGDWKKAIASFMGYYGTTPLMTGQLIKIYLTLFRMLSPTLQESFTYGALDTAKSFIIGILLSVFQITAPFRIREPLIKIFDVIREKKEKIDGVLTDQGLHARPSYLTPSFEDFNNLQALMDDPEFICSCEFKELVETVDQASIIHIILQMLRIPVTQEFREYRCGKEDCKPFITKIVEKGLGHEVKSDTEKPVAEETPEEKTEEKPEEKPEEKTEEKPEEKTEEKTEETSLPPTIEPKTEEKPEEKTEETSLPPTIESKTEEPKTEETSLPPTIEEVKPEVKEPPLPPTIGGKRRRTPRLTRLARQQAHE